MSRKSPLMRDPDETVEARMTVDPEFAIALYHEQRKLIKELERIIDEIHATLYGRGFEILGWHLNGATEPLDRFFESSNWSKDGDA